MKNLLSTGLIFNYFISYSIGCADNTITPLAAGKLAIPESGAYTGAYLDFGSHEDTVTLESIEDFTGLVGKSQAVIAFSNYWGRKQFPLNQVRIIANTGAVPLIYWNPWNSQQDDQADRFDIERIADGKWDNYLDAWARDARAFGRPLLVAWGIEMNGFWFPWGGGLHGGGKVIPGSNPPRYQGPEAFKRAYRHVVDRVRATGVTNISWVFHVNNTSDPDEPWNHMAFYYPGSDYVDWLGMSAYGKQFPGENWITVKESILDHYPELTNLDATKPIILAEWGVAEFPKQGNKGAWIREAMQEFERLPRLKGGIFWQERWQNGDLSYSNLRVQSSLGSLTAYREGITRPFWLSVPQVISPTGTAPTQILSEQSSHQPPHL